MKIAINIWILRNKNLDGIGYFTIHTLKELIHQHPNVEFLLLCDKGFTENYFDFPNVVKHKIFPALRHPVLYFFYMEFVAAAFLKRHKPDLFLSMDGFLSLLSNSKQLPVIYDINFEHKPEDLPLRNRVYFRTFFKKFARKATRIATISEYSKNDIANYYQIAKDKIDNVSCGVNEKFFVLNEDQKNEARVKFANGSQYFFFVGSMHPRKNIKRLIHAFSLFKEKSGSDFKLVLAGSILWSKTEIEDVVINSIFREEIVFTGRLSDADLQLALGGAYCLTFAPIFEGFGLPIVEAFQAGVPVICSNVTSMPEVAGNAAIQFDPFDVAEISNAMETIYNHPDLRENLIKNGNTQKNNFSWSNTAKLLWESIRSCMG